MKWRHWAVALVLALGLVAGACSSDDLSTAQDPTEDEAIRIGWVGPLSAGAISAGNEMLAATEIAVEEVNASGGVLGRNLELVVRDTMADPDTGVTAMEELLDDENVVAVLGEVHSSVAVAEIEVAHDRGVPFLVADAWADEITGAGYAEVFRIAPVNSLIYETVSAWLLGAGFDDVVVVAESTAFGREASALIRNELESAGRAVDVIEVDAANIDIDEVLGQLGSGNLDLVMILVASDTVYSLITAICDAGLAPSPSTALYVGAGAAVTSTFWEEVDGCGRYVIAESLVLPEEQWNDLASGLAAALDAPGEDVATGGFAGYDSVWLMADAIRRAGSTNPDDITAALASTMFVGARGEYSFSRDSEPGWHYQTFLDAPISVTQYSEVGQSTPDALILAPDKWATAETILAPG